MTTPPSFQGIVFDMDGTLAATEPLHMDAWLSVLQKAGLPFDEDWFQQWVGLSDKILAEAVVRDYAIELSVAELQEQKRNLFHATARRKAKLFEGIDEALTWLQQRIPLAMATSSSDLDAEAVFANTQLQRFFRTIVTADRVTNVKPAPEPYLLACRELNLPPTQCIAIEDSPAGVTSARRAGLIVLGVTTSKTPEQLREAHRVFPNTGAAIGWLREAMSDQR